MQHLNFQIALEEWTRAIGPEWVDTSVAEMRESATTTFATDQVVLAKLRPGSLHEVQTCVAIANRHRVALYPISTGKNWGYGSRVPAISGCVLLDLGRMNRIVDFNEELAYVTVEPGVTQRQLFTYLNERGSKLWMDATGSSPDCSLIGNAMERGFHAGPSSERRVR